MAYEGRDAGGRKERVGRCGVKGTVKSVFLFSFSCVFRCFWMCFFDDIYIHHLCFKGF